MTHITDIIKKLSPEEKEKLFFAIYEDEQRPQKYKGDEE
jgi:hypothetical protein